MSVQRYELEIYHCNGGEMIVSDTGDYVSHDDYAALEAKCAALAAENAALKSAIQTHSESVHFCELCGKDDPCSTDDVCMVLNETPATDAFLAEVRAQGVDMFGQYHNFSEKLFIQKEAKMFAAQLRQEAAQ